MAKKKTDEITDIPVETGQETSENELTEVTPEQVPITKDRSPFVDNILKSYPAYKTLYIDSHGGCYTPDTPVGTRKGAILYENPFYQP